MTDSVAENLRFNPQDRTLQEWIDTLHASSTAAGWWDDADSGDSDPMYVYATKIGLIHSEVTEMFEGLRKGGPDDHLPHRSMEEVEAADVFIRLADYCGKRGIDLAGAVVEKLEYNQHRADHKAEARAADGGKKF